MYDIQKIRSDFPILERMVDSRRKLIYLDSGATSQKPKVVIDKINTLYTVHNSNIHRGVHKLSGECTVMYEQSREIVREFIGASSLREVVFTSGATMSINLVAMSWGLANVFKGDEILVSEMEHHANIVPWQLLCERTGATLKVLPFDDNGDLMYEELDNLLTDRTKLVAVTEVSNVLGTINDLELIIKRSHDVGAIVLVDGCQGIVHNRVNVTELDCDFYVFSGHKLYAPTGIGVLYGKEKLLNNMPPYMGGGDMVSSVSFLKTTYADLPLKFEAGTVNYIGAIALSEAINYLNSIGLDDIHLHEKMLLDYAVCQLGAIDGLIIYGTSEHKSSIISFNIEGIHALDLGMILDKLGIAVRTGTHCAEPTLAHFGVHSVVRATFVLYNTKEEIDSLVSGIKQAIIMLK